DPIIYRDIQAKDFVQRSSKKSKENIKECVIDALDIINSLEVKEFNYVGSDKKSIGFIAEESKAVSSDGEFISHGDLLATLTMAIQQINEKLEGVKMNNQPNKDYMNQSLVSQIARLSMQIAERDAIITEQQQELEEIRKEQISEMDEDGKDGGHKEEIAYLV